MRKTRAKKRVILPDPKFGQTRITQFVNNLMLGGKKEKAFNLFYDAVEIIKERTSEDGVETWEKALHNITPQVEVRSRRIGGATFQVPRPIRDERKESMGMKWLIAAARKRNEKGMALNLASEIIAGAKEEGAAYKKKEDTHRMAEANKAFSHFRF
jgi:small subunit ribosomal protein S7